MDCFDSPEMIEAISARDRGDYSAAFEALKPLAEAGNPKAECNLATLYHLGLGVEANAERAIELYLKVAEQQIYDEHLSAIAYHNLAQIYSCCHGGIEPDPQKAREYRVRSKELGFEM